MSVCTWILQSNFGRRHSGYERMVKACEENGRPFVSVEVVPFSGELPDALVPVQEPAFVYGSTTLILNIQQHSHLPSAVYFDAGLFNPRTYLERYGDLCLNNDARILTVADFMNAGYPDSEKLFVRSNDDLKVVTGNTRTYAEWKQSFENIDAVSEGARMLGTDSEILVSSSKEIGHEWRLFIVDGRVATGSQYAPLMASHIPPEAKDFAEAAARRWSPSDIFVMDLCAYDGGWRILELNCANGSGLYQSDARTLVRTVSLFRECS